MAYGTRLLIHAVASGKAAARSVYQYLTGRKIALEQTTSFIPLSAYTRRPGYEAIRRVPVELRPVEERLQRPDVPVELGYSASQAVLEATRCLNCSVTPIFDSSRCILCGGCADVCPTQCLKLVDISQVELELPNSDDFPKSAILKDEARCIRCACCAKRCPVDAITMEQVTLRSSWETEVL